VGGPLSWGRTPPGWGNVKKVICVFRLPRNPSLPDFTRGLFPSFRCLLFLLPPPNAKGFFPYRDFFFFTGKIGHWSHPFFYDGDLSPLDLLFGKLFSGLSPQTKPHKGAPPCNSPTHLVAPLFPVSPMIPLVLAAFFSPLLIGLIPFRFFQPFFLRWLVFSFCDWYPAIKQCWSGLRSLSFSFLFSFSFGVFFLWVMMCG